MEICNACFCRFEQLQKCVPNKDGVARVVGYLHKQASVQVREATQASVLAPLRDCCSSYCVTAKDEDILQVQQSGLEGGRQVSSPTDINGVLDSQGEAAQGRNAFACLVLVINGSRISQHLDHSIVIFLGDRMMEVLLQVQTMTTLW